MTKEKLLDLCKSIDFPQTVLTPASLRGNFYHLRNTSNLSQYSNTCTQLIQHFHPSLWKANVKDFLSPFNAWYDDICILKSIENRLKYKGTELSPKDVRAGLTIGKIAPKISVFRPALAKYIINKYLFEYTEIFDPCSGYSGRLLGAVACKKKYIGQDINSITIRESNDLINYFELKNCWVTCKNSLCTTGKYECLFTCPPYSDKENWNQSIEDLSCDEWIDICLKNYDCKRYVFVIDKTEKYKKYIKEEINNKSYMSNSKEYIIIIDND